MKESVGEWEKESDGKWEKESVGEWEIESVGWEKEIREWMTNTKVHGANLLGTYMKFKVAETFYSLLIDILTRSNEYVSVWI